MIEHLQLEGDEENFDMLLGERMKAYQDVVRENHKYGCPFEKAELIRFLRAREYDSDEAKEMMEKNLSWRKEINYDSASPYWIDPSLMNGFIGMSRTSNGEMLITANFDYWNGKIPQEKLMHAFTYFMNLRARLQDPLELNRPDVIIMVDLGQYSISYFDRNRDKNFAVILQDHFPETLKKIYFLNAGKMYTMIWKFLCLWLDEKTANKLTMVKDIRDLEDLPVEDIPEYFGGGKVVPENFKMQLKLVIDKCESIQKKSYEDLLVEAKAEAEELIESDKKVIQEKEN